MVSGFEKRMLSGMFGLLSVDCAKAGEVAPATASVTAPATTRLRETCVENCCESSEESVSAMVTNPAISAGSIAGLAPQARFVLVHSGHFIQNDQPDLMVAAK
jgi:hypothetical protein